MLGTLEGLSSLREGSRPSHHGEIRLSFQHERERVTEGVVVVDDHDPNLPVHRSNLSSNPNTEPSPGLFCTVSSEPWPRTMRWLRYRPRPTPGVLCLSGSRPRPNFSKILGTSYGWIPRPWSATSILIRSPFLPTRSSMGVPSGEYLAAFESRLRKTCPIRSGSASTRSPALKSPRTITSTGWCPGRVLAYP